MSLDKKLLSLEDIEAQTALDLPDREMMALVVITIGNVDIIDDITIDVSDVNVAAQVCAAVLATDTGVTCEVVQQ